MTIHEVAQRSPEWMALRLGRVTSSCAADMLASLKDPKKEAAGRRNLRVRLVLERITGRSIESTYQSAAMQQGTRREADALLVYEAITGRLLRSVGFVAHDTLMAGCSPDGVVGDFEGLVEAKCPLPATHLDYLRTGEIPGDYMRQIWHHLWTTGAAWCDWLSFNPDFPEPLQMRIVRVQRDEVAVKSYELLLRQFLAEVQREQDEVMAMVEQAA